MSPMLELVLPYEQYTNRTKNIFVPLNRPGVPEKSSTITFGRFHDDGDGFYPRHGLIGAGGERRDRVVGEIKSLVAYRNLDLR